MTTRKYSKIQATPLRGGMITTREPALLKFGQFSQVQNLRPERPGFRKRPGQAKLHTTADSTNGVLSIYQFKKQKVTEQHLYAQMSDSDVLEATSNPPTVTTGAFGSEVFDGTASPRPASWERYKTSYSSLMGWIPYRSMVETLPMCIVQWSTKGPALHRTFQKRALITVTRCRLIAPVRQ